MSTHEERRKRARKMATKLKKLYPKPATELLYTTPFQLVVAVMLSAQCTDKKVNECTDTLFKKYKTPEDFAVADLATFAKEVSSVTFYCNKAKHIIATAERVVAEFDGNVPKTIEELVTLPGIAYKTANVVLGELYDTWEGIATDTHVRRFALRFNLTDNTDLTKISKDLEALISKKDWKYVNNGLVLYGRHICPARPHDCGLHALSSVYPESATIWPKAK